MVEIVRVDDVEIARVKAQLMDRFGSKLGVPIRQEPGLGVFEREGWLAPVLKWLETS